MRSDRPSDVADALANRLAQNPGDREAYRALCEHYRAEGDVASLANLIAGFASFTKDDQEGSRAYQEVARLLEDSLGDERRAEGFFRRAVQRDPQNLEAAEGLQALLARSGRLPELTALVTGQLETLERQNADPRDLAVLCYRLGELWGKHFDRPDEALVHYRRAYDLDPRLLRAVYEARLLLLARGDRRGAVGLYEKEAAAESEPARKGLLLRELGSLYLELDDSDGAVAAFDRAKALAPSDVELAHLLASALVRRSETLDERTRATDLDRVASLLCEIAAALSDQEARPFLISALSHAPWHSEALAELERRTPAAEATRVLSPHWVAYLTHNPNGAGAQDRRMLLARAYAAEGQLEDAIFCVTPAAERGIPAALQLLAELRDEAAPITQDAQLETTRPNQGSFTTRPAPARAPDGSPDFVTQITDRSEIAALLEQARDAVSEPPRPSVTARAPRAQPQPEAIATPIDLDSSNLVALHRDLARLVAQGRIEEMVALAERISWLDPLDAEAFALLDRHYRRERSFARRAELLARSADAEDLPIPTRKQRLREAANLFETRVSDIDAALDAHRKLTALEPDNEDVVRGLRRLLERSQRWDELARVLEDDARTQRDPAAKVTTLRRLCELQRRELGDRNAAVQVLREIVELDPEDRAARLSLTEELIALERFDEAGQSLKQRIDQTASEPERLPLLRQLAGLLENKIGDRESAFQAYERILEIIPDDTQALDRMEEIDEVSGAHERLIATLSRRAQHASPAQAADLHVRMATVAEADLLDQDRAAELLRKALALAPANLQILMALSNLYERAGRDNELLALLRERAGSEKNAKARADILRRIGRLLSQRLNDDLGAAEAFTKVLELGEDREALLFMERRARAENDATALADLLVRLAEVEDTPESRRERLLERATCLETLARPLDAIETLARVSIELSPADDALLQRVRALCDAAADHRGLARVLEQRLRSTEPPEARAAAARELSDLYETKLPDEAKTLRALREWSSTLPDDPAPRRRLASLFERKRRYKDLVTVLDELARVESTLDARQDALLRAAELCLFKLKDDAGAFERLASQVRSAEGPLDPRILELARRASRVAELAALCEACDRFDELFALLRELIDGESDADEKTALLRKLARALIDHRQDEAAALSVYDELLQKTDDAEALRFVQAWAVRHDDPARLERALERLARIEKNHHDKRDLLFERGRLLHSRLDRAQDAIAILEEALAIDGRFEPALDELIEACSKEQAHATLAPALERKLGMLHAAEDKIEVLRRLATLYDGALHDERRALHAFDRWVAIDGSDPEPLRGIRTLHARAGRFHELVTTLDALSDRESSEPARIEAQVAAATVVREHLRDPSGAFARLLPLAPAAIPQVDTLLEAWAAETGKQDELFDRLEDAARYDALATLLDTSAEQTADRARRTTWLLRLAKLADQRLGDEALAQRSYDRVLELEENAVALRYKQARALQDDDAETLSSVLARLAAIEADPREQRDLLYEHAHLLNLRLSRPADAIAVLRQVVRLDPTFEPGLDELVSAAQAADDHDAHAEGLTQLMAAEAHPSARAELAARLSDLCEGPLQAPERAISALEVWAAAEPEDLEPLRRMRTLLTATGRNAALVACLDTIATRTQDPGERERAQLTAAGLLRDALNDPAEAWTRLLPMAEAGNLEADRQLRQLAFASARHDELTQLYERMARYDELVELLRERAEESRDPGQKADLYLRCAEILANTVGDEIAAAEAYREVLALREDVHALEYLRGAAERLDDVDTLEDLLQRSAAAHEDRSQKRDLLLARALLLNDRLDRTSDAVDVLRQIVTTLDPSCLPAIEELIATAESVGNASALALGLERKLILSKDASVRPGLALRLADLYEGELDNPDLATEALRRYCEADPSNVEGHKRLRAQLTRQKRPEELLAVLDALCRIETTKAARHEALLSAAKLAQEGLADAKGAFTRLAPLVQAGDVEAELLAEAICKGAGLGRELAGVYIRRAQKELDRDDARASWRRVVRIHETWLHEPAEAFEASLRLLALDTRDRAQLDEVDRLGIQLQAFPRLSQIYGKLVNDATLAREQGELLVRLATIFEVHAREPNTALELLMQTCKLGNAGEDVFEHAEALTRRLGNHADLLWIEEQRADRAQTPESAISSLLEAARTSDIGLGDREEANTCLRRALALTEQAPQLTRAIEELAAELDRARPALGKEDARRALVRAHVELAADATAEFHDALFIRAARFLRDELHDEAASFDTLRQGTSNAPFSESLLDALEASTLHLGRLDALHAHFARIADRAADKQDKQRLLLRRARVLDEHLGRADQAAQAYERALELDPENEAVATQLVTCLKKAGRYRELLHALDRRLQRVSDVSQRLPLMREMASIWEIELKNRASARELWIAVHALAPQDEEAGRALERLGTG